MGISSWLLSVALLAAPDLGPGWKRAKTERDLTVFSRKARGSNIHETKAVGTFDAPPRVVWAAIRDYDRYEEFIPYVKQSRIVEREGAVLHVHSELKLPIVSERDYVLRVVDESKGDEYLATWTASDKGPPPRAGVIRITNTKGFWHLEPIDGGKRTRGTYYIFSDPAGALPAWVANRGNTTAIPDIFNAFRKQLPTYAAKAPPPSAPATP
jgi:hypothetical protein